MSAMPAAGLRSTSHVMIHDADRFVREFMELQDEANPYEPIENVHTTTYKKNDPEKPIKEMALELGLELEGHTVERSRQIQDELRGGPPSPE